MVCLQFNLPRQVVSGVCCCVFWGGIGNGELCLAKCLINFSSTLWRITLRDVFLKHLNAQNFHKLSIVSPSPKGFLISPSAFAVSCAHTHIDNGPLSSHCTTESITMGWLIELPSPNGLSFGLSMRGQCADQRPRLFSNNVPALIVSISFEFRCRIVRICLWLLKVHTMARQWSEVCFRDWVFMLLSRLIGEKTEKIDS